ncbi:hypothetical protein [Roseivirga thermotolerans]|uniref:hypothetical protein n=1 Tax=Roseivirga thermotolerans TaxID=1758176 RepID=UPI00273F5573|nr:hypothetical protein [Roseivirga thermotolerans]
MLIFIAAVALSFVVLIIAMVIQDRKAPAEAEKFMDDKTEKFLMGILLSVITSFALSSSASLPENSGLGGLLWLFAPPFIGGLTFFLFVLLLAFNKKLKTIIGWVCIGVNLLTGLYLLFLLY